MRDSELASPVILTSEDTRFLAAEQLREIGVMARKIVLEPVARNTAPAALVSALLSARENEDQLILLLPSDHVIADKSVFLDAMRAGTTAARNGHIVTFGVRPERAETAYGYIECEDGATAVRDVVRFIEKPSREKAEEFYASSRFLWNAGIFLFSAKTLIEAFETHAPNTLSACRLAIDKSVADQDFLRLNKEAYADAENISLDYAILEKVDAIKVIELETRWSDLGSWSAIWQEMDKDRNGNVSRGDVALYEAKNSYVQSEDGAHLTIIGLSDVLAIATRDAVLVAAKDYAQNTQQAVSQLNVSRSELVNQTSRVIKPWGWYETLQMGARFQVKCIMVKPGGRLSLQSHRHRAEHWVVVEGEFEVTIDETVKTLSVNEAVDIPLGAIHRLANPGPEPGYLIEVQSGSYLGEDDIVRYEDIYGRVEE